jgi:hypothetical protein
MPIHDWTRVSAGTSHDFHLTWIAEIRNALNGGVLPPDYYAQAEQIVGPMGPDVLTLQAPETDSHADLPPPGWSTTCEGGVATLTPRTRLIDQQEEDEPYAHKARTLVVRHSSGDRIVAMIEIVSPGNKSSQAALASFVARAIDGLSLGYHLLIIDLFPPGLRDPSGIHGAIWEGLRERHFQPPPGELLTLVAYMAGPPGVAYAEPTAIGRELLAMPLFLTPKIFVEVPLEATYTAAFWVYPASGAR